jgi:hypothetical protein
MIAVIGTIIGTLSATDVDTNNNDLVYSVNNTTDFEITGNQLKIKTDVTTITFPINITITASDAVLSGGSVINIGNSNSNLSGFTALTITATNEPDTQTLTYSISGADANLFNLWLLE